MIGLGLGLRSRGAFSPRSLFRKGEAGAWYDASDLAGMAQNSDGSSAAAVDAPVGRVRDRSGRGNHALQPEAGRRPMLRRDSGGRLYLEFDGVDDWLEASFACAQPWDRISAVRPIGWTVNRRLFGAVAVNSGTLFMDSTAPRIGIFSGAIGPGSIGAAVGVNSVVTERHHGASSRIAVNNEAYAAGDAGLVATDGIRIGNRDTGTQGSNIRFYGLVMIARTLSDVETMAVRRFMAARAGIAL